ncbi:hypothetical protein HZC53_04785 [Candidatus Uhrbacteria bacterium]|nr:hypothetical protein [Candidatus Uhrbacteria bacterium]
MKIEHKTVIRARAAERRASSEVLPIRDDLLARFEKILDRLSQDKDARESQATTIRFKLEDLAVEINRRTADDRNESRILRFFVRATAIDGAPKHKRRFEVESFNPKAHKAHWAILWTGKDWNWEQLEHPWERDLIVFGASCFESDDDVSLAFSLATGISLRSFSHPLSTAHAELKNGKWDITVHGWPTNASAIQVFLENELKGLR